MRKLIAAVGLCVSGFSATGVIAAGGTIVGYVSDTKCAMSGAAKKTAAEWIQPAAFEKCVKDCVKDGSEAVFVTEDNKILKFDAASKGKVTPFLGHKVSVTGTVTGAIIKIDSISGMKLE